MKILFTTSALVLSLSSTAFAANVSAALPTSHDIKVVTSTLNAETASLNISTGFYSGDFLQTARKEVHSPLYSGSGSAMMASVIMARF